MSEKKKQQELFIKIGALFNKAYAEYVKEIIKDPPKEDVKNLKISPCLFYLLTKKPYPAKEGTENKCKYKATLDFIYGEGADLCRKWGCLGKIIDEYPELIDAIKLEEGFNIDDGTNKW